MSPTYKYKIRSEDYDYDYMDGHYRKFAGGIFLVLCELQEDGSYVEVDQWDTDSGWNDKNTEIIEQISFWEDNDAKTMELHEEGKIKQ